MCKAGFQQLAEGIYRLCVPFEELYTSVFALTEGDGCILLDSACNEKDVQEVILPALSRSGFAVQMILCSHLHSDHCGGMEALLEAFPSAKAGLFDKSKKYGGKETVHFSDGDMLLGRYKVLNLKGHTEDCLAVFDTKTATLLSVDCLQLRGIGRYGTSVCCGKEYRATLERVRGLGVQRIIASHEYIPCGAIADGADRVKNYLDECEKAIDCICELAMSNPELDLGGVARLYNKSLGLPPIWEGTVEALMK